MADRYGRHLEQWKDRQSGEVIRSCAVITVPSNALMMPLNERMPVILREDQWPKWLGEVPAHEQEIKDMMQPYPAENMTLWPYSIDMTLPPVPPK